MHDGYGCVFTRDGSVFVVNLFTEYICAVSEGCGIKLIGWLGQGNHKLAIDIIFNLFNFCLELGIRI
jgi:hypothetical protein